MTRRSLTAVIISGLLAFFSLGVGLFQFFCRAGGGAEWLTAAGGFALISFAAVQLHLEGSRESARQEAARAKLKPVARLARRACEAGVVASNGKALNQWLGEWYLPMGQDNHAAIDVLETRMRETVTLAAEAGGPEVGKADRAFDAFIAAADIINEMSKTLRGMQEDKVLRDNNARGREAANHLAAAARELEGLSPRGQYEPAVLAEPRFLYEP
jgi:hypothetical protein